MEKVIKEYSSLDLGCADERGDALKWLNQNIESLNNDAYLHFNVAQAVVDVIAERLLTRKKWCYSIMVDENRTDHFYSIYYFQNLEDAVMFKLIWG
jgi:hypothetical protein